MNVRGLEIQRLSHACFKVEADKTIYFDPFEISDNADKPADLILISHEHYDHCSPNDLVKIITNKTVIVASRQCGKSLAQIEGKVAEIHYMRPEDIAEIFGIKIEAVAAYNVNKFRAPGQPFHPKQDEKLGYVVTTAGRRIYHTGDTDLIPEMENLKDVDVAFLPVSGTYVMTAEEAAEAVKMIKPKVAIPMHYGAIVGTRNDAERFAKLAVGIEIEILD